ncbi:MAG: hypothetical protein CFE26_01455 [Verrucomicrobiales bacterium VVV1]|nr:MAG: hypothetical protein CFE26_01455 [Verrucomicrobiales bacterium VVV1]
MADHVHLAVRLSRTVSIADLINELKTSSSKWLKERSPALSKFAWQRGYGSFSIGPCDLDAVSPLSRDSRCIKGPRFTKTTSEESPTKFNWR